AYCWLGPLGIALDILVACLAALIVGLTRRQYLLAFGPIGVCVAAMCLLPSTRMPREASRRSVCVNNLKQIGLALQNYHDDFGCFPPAYIADENGRPMHSWRVLILPYIEQVGL